MCGLIGLASRTTEDHGKSGVPTPTSYNPRKVLEQFIAQHGVEHDIIKALTRLKKASGCSHSLAYRRRWKAFVANLESSTLYDK